MELFKVEGQHDTVYVVAEDFAHAQNLGCYELARVGALMANPKRKKDDPIPDVILENVRGDVGTITKVGYASGTVGVFYEVRT
jgi:hypothetical protein